MTETNSSHRFNAGFASSIITLPGPVQMSGFAARTAPSEGVHDPLYARAAAFTDGGNTAVLIVLDLIGADHLLTRLVREKVAAICAVPATQVAVTATHTHGGPAVLSGGQLGEADPALLESIATRAAEAARLALDRLTPCEVRTARGSEDTVARNRRDPAGAVDHSLDVIRFDSGDRCLGIVVSYACHPVVLGADNLQITRDYPGFLVDDLEAAFPGTTVLFLTGAAGQLNTGHRAHDSWTRAATQRRSFVEARRIGRLLAAVASRVAADARHGPARGPGPVLLAGSALTLPLQEDPAMPDIRSRWAAELERLPAGHDTRPLLEASLRWADGLESLPAQAGVEVQALGICGHALALFPGEVFTEYGLALKERFLERITTVGYANSAPGYLPTDAALAEGGYEVAEAHRFYGQRGPFAAGTQDAVVGAMIRCVGQVLG